MRLVATGTLISLLLCAAGYGQTMPSSAEQMLNEMLRPGPTVAHPATRPDDLSVVQPDGYKPPPPAPQLLREDLRGLLLMFREELCASLVRARLIDREVRSDLVLEP